MIIDFMLYSLLTLFFTALIGYVLSVVKEKYYLWNNTIFIDSKTVTEEHIREIDSNFFKVGNVEMMAGDEIKIVLNDQTNISGIVLEAKIQANSMYIVNKNDEIELVELERIRKFKVVSKYGKILPWF